MPSFPPDWDNLERQLKVDVESAVATLLEAITALNTITATANGTINGNPAATIKDLTREVKTVARQTVRIARLVSGAFDSADTGT